MNEFEDLKELRATRRKHRERLKKKRRQEEKNIFGNNGIDDKHLNILIDTKKRCSCYMCGNPRKHFREKTRKELIMDLIEEEMLDE